jgi:N4-gp56 family major capsid protein
MALPTVASVVTSGLGAYPTLFFDRVALDTLQSNLFMYPACEYKTLPDRSGNVIRIFDNTAMTANTTPITEGTPFAGQAMTENTRDITLSQYVDYISFADKSLRMHIVDVLAEGAQLLAYRGALSVDTVISTAVDVAANSDSATPH